MHGSETVRDCFRLGRYSREKCRPVLIKLTCARNVTSILSNRKKLAESEKYNKIYLKRDMSLLERQEEALLLKERWTLINLGTPRRDVQLKGSQLLVRNIVVGSIQNMKYVPVADSVSYNSSHLSHPRSSD